MWISNMFQQLYWHQVTVLWGLLLPVVLLLLNALQQRFLWAKLAQAQLQPWLKLPIKKNNNLLLQMSLLASYSLLIIALAGPRTIQSIPPQFSPIPAELNVIIDFSASMNAQDVYPNRRLAAIQLLERIAKHKPSHLKIGIVVFAGHAFQVMPATLDTQVIEHFIHSIKKLRLPTLGNDLSAAVKLVDKVADKKLSDQHMIIMSDGDLGEAEQQQVLSLLSSRQSEHKAIQMIAIGKKQPIAVPDFGSGFIKLNGRIVQTQLQQQWFRQLNQLQQVDSLSLNQANAMSVATLLNLAPVNINEKLQAHIIWHEWFFIPALLALLLLVLSVKWQQSLQRSVAPFVGFFMLCVLLSYHSNTLASQQKTLDQAIQLMQQQHYPQVIKLLQATQQMQEQFVLGVACYYEQDFNCASKAFSQTAWNATSPKLRAQSVFNLANAQFFLGQYEQASVLYDAAKKLGFDAKQCDHNQQYADSIQTSIEREVDEIKKSFQKAKWHASAFGLPQPDLNQFVASQRNITQFSKDKVSQAYLVSRMTNLAIKQQLGLVTDVQTSNTEWVKTQQAKAKTTDALLKRLFEMQLSIPSSLQQPKALKGQRTW